MDVRGITPTALRRNIGRFQEALFNRSIADNLRVGRPDATEGDAPAAARAQALGIYRSRELKSKSTS